MAPDQKKRHVVSYENMSEALAAAFNEKYPRGFSDYLPDLVKYPKPDGTSFYAVTVETDDSINLVKIKVKTDDAEALERWLEGEILHSTLLRLLLRKQSYHMQRQEMLQDLFLLELQP